MKKIKILFLLLLAGGGLSHASVQKTLFSADVVASACHVVVDADGTGGTGSSRLTFIDGTGSSRLTFGTYRKSSAAPVPPRDFTVRLYETGATVQGCSAFLAGQIATLNFGNPGQPGRPACPTQPGPAGRTGCGHPWRWRRYPYRCAGRGYAGGLPGAHHAGKS
ncbi:K88 fimbrial protein A precursor [Salmonella enterica subsp. enterica serovar Minnesota str. A4-603]|nr:K88 fimbrial protein A precursor [Salmonella enterica subsp. enterica serovar Minnesota str. A4-603]